MYRCVTGSIEGFIQQLAVSYIGHGYWFYASGHIPEAKDPVSIDAKLLSRYGVDMSKWARARRKRSGWANLHYLRHERFFVLLATHGHHRFFEAEADVIRDVRRAPIKYGGYSVSYRGGHPHVRIEQRQYQLLKSYFLEAAQRQPAERLARAIRGLAFEPYAPVRRQLFNLVRAVNRERKVIRREPVPMECVRIRRRVVRPFDSDTR